MNRTAYAQNRDIARFEAKARRGEIGHHAVVPLAVVFAACRKAQTAIGPGHQPLDALLEALPPQYVNSWLARQHTRHQRSK